jgi:hypothetical protein
MIRGKGRDGCTCSDEWLQEIQYSGTPLFELLRSPPILLCLPTLPCIFSRAPKIFIFLCLRPTLSPPISLYIIHACSENLNPAPGPGQLRLVAPELDSGSVSRCQWEFVIRIKLRIEPAVNCSEPGEAPSQAGPGRSGRGDRDSGESECKSRLGLHWQTPSRSHLCSKFPAESRLASWQNGT